MYSFKDREDWMKKHHKDALWHKLSTKERLDAIIKYCDLNQYRMSIFYKYNYWQLITDAMSAPIFSDEGFDDLISSAYIYIIEGIDIEGDMNEAHWNKVTHNGKISYYELGLI